VETHKHHKHEAPQNLKIAIVTVSTTRDPQTDGSGGLLKELIEKNGHSVAGYAVIPDLIKDIVDTVQVFIEDGVDAVIVNGGTGITNADVTIEALKPLFTKEITGFGHLFAILTYEDIGTAGVNSRATAGIISGRPVYCIPGSPNACRLATEKLIMPEIGHTVKHARGG
jgi:molybdenum cofactor biosynthesis protein B